MPSGRASAVGRERAAHVVEVTGLSIAFGLATFGHIALTPPSVSPA